MAITVFLFVDKPVASLQLDLDTQGSFSLDPSVAKQVLTNRLGDGKLRVVIYSLGVDTFSGRFGIVDGAVLSISNVVGATPEGTDAEASVGKLSSPQSVLLDINAA